MTASAPAQTAATRSGRGMKQYLLSIYQPVGNPPAPEVLEAIMKRVLAVRQEAIDAGVWVFAAGLHPTSSATVVRVKNGETLMTDGPFVEGKEHLGGFVIIRAPDLDAALAWARKEAEATTLPIEVRPLQGEVDA